ncbi:ankyrin repeat domain-containing protein 13C-like [Clytia hemisphaerica]|uniref:Ankyrin repeat domain-containing protein n=1 Tax=Clytia hemisphaerica TaxID=252671 RepID=A0A7M5XKG9_9CNID|eukprot:TCONS_00030096-protein
MSVEEETDFLPLHETIFLKDAKRLEHLIESQKYDIDKKDKFGNTALHIAAMIGATDCLQCLLKHKADANIKNLNGWTPLAETVSYGSRTAIKSILRRIKQQNRENMDIRRPTLVKTLKDLNDFEMELRWEFHSWVPLLSRLLPSDVCKISKKGSAIRMDSTLIEFTDMKWKRGDITFLFRGDKETSENLIVMDNENKVFQKIQRNEIDSTLEEEVDYLMCSDIVSAQMSTKTINFTPAQNGWIFKEDKVEVIGKVSCDVYHVHGMNLISKKRREHLSEEDMRKNKELSEAFHRGDTMLMENEKCQPLTRKNSLTPPMENPWSFVNYIESSGLYLGRDPRQTESKKTIKGNVWMSEDFPLSTDLILNILNVIAPAKHFQKMKDFVSLKLPPGFPVKIEIPVLPTIVARVSFHDFEWKNELDDDLFVLPTEYKEDPNHFPDL